MRLKRPKKRLRKPEKWRDTHYVKSYRLALDGLTDGKIAEALGVSRVTFHKWRKERKALRLALKSARTKMNGSRQATFSDYVARRLPPHLVPVWERLNAADEMVNPERRAEEILAGQGEGVRKHLFVHAYVSSNFNKAEACRKANVSGKVLKEWVRDVEFAQLLDQVLEMKKDFVDGCLMGLVAQGDTAATIFAAKALLKDRGYDTAKTVRHEGTVDVAHTVEFEKLPLELRTQILDWSEKNGHVSQEVKMLGAHQDAADAEYEVK